MKRLLLVSLPIAVSLLAAATAVDAHSEKFTARLTGDQEVPPRDTQASGRTEFRLDDDDDDDMAALEFRLRVANISNVTAAHIHCAPEGVNGPVGVTLFRGTTGSGRFSGTLARGTITSPDAGNACGWTTLDQVIDAMEDGNTYVNVHTTQFPGGELRGQIH